jgi:hypothetical protein
MDDSGYEDEMNALWDEEESLSGDPFENLTASEQDIFFRVVDLLPDDLRNSGIEYFMDNPRKIRAIVDNVKAKREIIKNQDKEALQQLLDQEQIVIQKIDEMSVS